MIFRLLPPFRRTIAERDTHELLNVIVASSLAVIEEIQIGVTEVEFKEFPTAALVEAKLQPVKELCKNNPEVNELLKATSEAIATHCKPKVTARRPLFEQYAKAREESQALRTGASDLLALKKKVEDIRSTASPLYRAAHASYLRLGLWGLCLGVAVAGEAGLVFSTWQNQLGNDDLPTQLIAGSMAVATLGINELMVRVGFAPLYAQLSARRRSTSTDVSSSADTAPAPAPMQPLTKKAFARFISSFSERMRNAPWFVPVLMALLHLGLNFGIILLRREFVSEQLESIFLANSVGALTVLSILTHFLLETLISAYPKARDEREKAAVTKDEVRLITAEIQLCKGKENKIKRFDREMKRLDLQFQRAGKRAHSELLRDPKVASTVRIFANSLAKDAVPNGQHARRLWPDLGL